MRTGAWTSALFMIPRLIIVLALAATVISTLRVYPHQLAYFNEAAGGPENGHKHLLHSNFDWGQDYLLVREWMDDNAVSPSEVVIATSGFHGVHGQTLVSTTRSPAKPRYAVVSRGIPISRQESALRAVCASLGHTTQVYFTRARNRM